MPAGSVLDQRKPETVLAQLDLGGFRPAQGMADQNIGSTELRTEYKVSTIQLLMSQNFGSLGELPARSVLIAGPVCFRVVQKCAWLVSRAVVPARSDRNNTTGCIFGRAAPPVRGTRLDKVYLSPR